MIESRVGMPIENLVSAPRELLKHSVELYLDRVRRATFELAAESRRREFHKGENVLHVHGLRYSTSRGVGPVGTHQNYPSSYWNP